MNILEPMWDAKFLRRLIISDLFKNPSGFFEGNNLEPNPNSGILIAQLGLTKKKLSHLSSSQVLAISPFSIII